MVENRKYTINIYNFEQMVFKFKMKMTTCTVKFGVRNNAIEKIILKYLFIKYVYCEIFKDIVKNIN